MNCAQCNAKFDAFYHKDICPKCGWNHKTKAYSRSNLEENAERMRIEIEQQYAVNAKNEYDDGGVKKVALESLKANGATGYYEYKVKTVVDQWGRTDIATLTATLNEMGMAGWHLVTAHTNELGKNAIAALGFGINSTADETVLIFERFVKI